MTTLCEVLPLNSAPPPHEAAPPPSSSLLAPGFRFHPTDEELVSYYLKRKVKGLPLRVDAIAEVDLYKTEPWELPSLSRLRTGDKEWYFFGALDRKYANRSRTNRATGKGYWKTTGKDRPVRNGSRLVGMKKTLVFHEGRAPHGKRTNWVMHEYRLEDESLSPDLPQGSFVVCRVFEKTGSGPQNGAQYGAPFVEEEWDAVDDLAPLNNPLPDTLMDTPGEQDYNHADDYEQKQVLVDQHESTAIVVSVLKEENIGGGQLDGPAFSLEELLDLDACFGEHGLQDDINICNNMCESSGNQEQSHNPVDQNDGYLELNDIFDNANMDNLSSDSLDEVGNYHIIKSGVNRSTPLSEVEDTDLFFDIPNETPYYQGVNQMNSPTDPQAENFGTYAAGDYTSGQLTEDNTVFYNTPSNEPLHAQSTNDHHFSPAADLSGFDMVDELMAYFDATENNLQSDVFNTIGNLEYVSSAVMPHSDSVPEVGSSSQAPGEANLLVSGTSTAREMPRSVSANKQLEGTNEDYSFAAGVQSNEGWNSALKKRVVNMLGSISAPPALAEGSVKGKDVDLLSTAHAASSIRVSAGMIQIHGSTMISTEHWTLRKNGDLSFFLSYGAALNDFVGKPTCLEPVSKMQGGVSTLLLRSGWYLFGISVLILSVSFKVAMCVYNK